MKSLFILLIAICAVFEKSFASAQTLGVPSREVLEKRARDRNSLQARPKTGEIAFEESDFDWPRKGNLRKADLKRLNYINSLVSGELAATPNGIHGTQSERFMMINALSKSISRVVYSEAQADLFLVLPNLITFVERKANAEFKCEELESAEAYIIQAGTYLIRALSYHIVHEQGAVSADLLRQAVRLFGNGRLVDETAWDVDDPMPVDSAGIFILNPELAVEELKKRPVERVRFFLTNVTDSGEFFERYGGEGDGLEVLKARYAANRAAIEAKHREMVAWLGAQSGQ